MKNLKILLQSFQVETLKKTIVIKIHLNLFEKKKVGGSKNYEMKKSKMLIGRKKFGPNFQNSFVDIPMSDLNQKLRTISRKHAYIHYNSDRQIFFLQSLGRNGTKVDGVVQKGFVQLKPNSSKIEIGKQLLTLELKK